MCKIKKYLSPILLLLALTVHAQELPTAAIDSLFAEWDRPGTPGCALGIFQDGQIVYAKGYGMANLEYDIPISPKSVFRIGSTSKQFTAACVVLLAQDGKLNLEDPLRSFFPEFPAYGDSITVRHLMLHTSGIRDYLVLSNLKGYGDDDYYEDRDVLRWLVRQKRLNFSPGEEWMYSNSGYWLLGQIVEKASGKNMADFAREAIFQPLGMEHTHFHNDHTMIVKNRASGYEPGPDEEGYHILMTTLDMIGDGGIFTTIEDIKKWDDAFYGSEVLSPEFWSVMTTPGRLNNGDSLDYAGGLFIETYQGLPLISHGGAFVGFRAELMRFPEQRTSIVIFANRADANPTRLAYQVADLVLEKHLAVEETATNDTPAAKPMTAPGGELPFSKLTGTYNFLPGLDVEISIEDDSLHVEQLWDGTTYNIIRLGGNSFIIPGEDGILFAFSELEDGLTQALTITQDGQELPGKRKPDLDLASLRLEDYVGRYYNEELDVTYEFSVHQDQLQLSIDGRDPRPVKPDSPDVFTTRWWRFSFDSEGGQVTGFELEAGRVKGLLFEREGNRE